MRFRWDVGRGSGGRWDGGGVGSGGRGRGEVGVRLGGG